MDSGQLFDAVIVGGGLAGTTVAAELALTAPPDFRLLLIDAGGEPGPGTAYAAPSNRLFMNGTARAMSAVPGDKHHLVRWLQTEPETALISRRAFGRYLSERFREALKMRPAFESAHAEVVDVAPGDGAFTIVDAHGGERLARHVVLALGNFEPDYGFLPPALSRHSGFVADPWRFAASRLPRHGDALVVGSGLTALDAIALLDEMGFDGRIHIVSRRGLVPCVDNPFAHALDPGALDLDTSTPHRLLQTLRAAARRHVAAGGDWRDVVEAIRTISPRIWTGWSERDRKRFLRHLQAYWSIHRYRVPPKTAAVYDRLRREGRLIRHRGQITDAAELANGRVRVEVTGPMGKDTLVVSATINCTGPNGNYERVRHPLVAALLRRGVMRPDSLRLGIDATPELRVRDARGNAHERLYALGPPLRGIFYETTAVPETREQAAHIARLIAGERTRLRLETAS